MLTGDMEECWQCRDMTKTPVTQRHEKILINWSMVDRSRVHLHGVEPRKIVLLLQWREATRELPPSPK